MEVTVRQVAEAMVIDDTPKVRGSLIIARDDNGGEVLNKDGYYNFSDPRARILSCAVGGAAVTLGLDPDSLAGALVKVDRDGVPAGNPYITSETLYEAVYGWNDSTLHNVSKAEIGRIVLDNADEATLNTVLRVRKETRKRLLALKKV